MINMVGKRAAVDAPAGDVARKKREQTKSKQLVTDSADQSSVDEALGTPPPVPAATTPLPRP